MIKKLQPLDRNALTLIITLTIVILIVLISGDRTAPRVRTFNWQNQEISAKDTAFTLTFTRPMEHKSVESQIKITPDLRGKISWAGRKMAYTLNHPAPYGNSYKIELQGVKELIPGSNTPGKIMEPFLGQFRTRERVFAYIGVTGDESGRLIIYNLKNKQKTVLTNSDLIVTAFKIDPSGSQIFYLAGETNNPKPTIETQQLYRVGTGITNTETDPTTNNDLPIGKSELLLDSNVYRNIRFDLSPDGKKIVILRVNRQDVRDFGLSFMDAYPGAKLTALQEGGEFVITPDSKAVAVAQTTGVAILPMAPDAEIIDFLPKFGTVLSFSNDGKAASLVKFNSDTTKSLFVVNNQGQEIQALKTTGSILDAKFSPSGNNLFALITEVERKEGELPNSTSDREKPYLVAVDLKNQKPLPLLQLPDQSNINMSLAPDGLALLFDQVIPVTNNPNQNNSLNQKNQPTNNGQKIANSLLWIVPLPQDLSQLVNQIIPEQLPLPGFYPQWLP